MNGRGEEAMFSFLSFLCNDMMGEGAEIQQGSGSGELSERLGMRRGKEHNAGAAKRAFFPLLFPL
jgi:hypothetical protein